MMKKCLLFLVLLIFISMGVFAQNFSFCIGAAGLYDLSLNNGAEIQTGGKTYYLNTHNMSFGGSLFFDFIFMEFDASFAYGFIVGVEKAPWVYEKEKIGNAVQVGITFLFKYPFDFGRVTFFPLLGGSYNMVFVSKDNDGNKAYESVTESIKYFSQFGLLGGAGIDIRLTGSLFLRIEAMYQLRFADKTTKDYTIDALEARYPGDDAYGVLGMGPRAKIGIGYKF